MINHIRHIIKLKPVVQQVAGVSLHFVNDQPLSATLCLLGVIEGRISVSARYSGLSLEELIQKIEKLVVPVYCTVDGDLVLYRRINLQEKADLGKYIQQMMPNTGKDDFFGQLHAISESDGILSVARRPMIDEVTNTFLSRGIIICHLSLGPFVIQNIFHLMDPLPAQIQAPGSLITIQEGVIGEIKKAASTEEKEFSIQGEIIPTSFIVPYAAALCYFIGDPEHLEITPLSELENSKEELKYFILYKQLYRFFPPVLLGLLLVNFLIFSIYSGKNKDLRNEYGSQFSRQQVMDSLNSDILKKKEIIGSLNWDQYHFSSFYADRLGASVTPGIIFTRVELFPLNSDKLNKEGNYEFDNSMIRVVGLCEQAQDLSEWVFKLKEQTWVRKIEDQKYQWNNEKRKGEFSLVILL